MPDLPKWVTEALTQMPALVAVFVAVVVTVRWMDRKSQEVLNEHKKHQDEQMTLLRQKYSAQLRTKDKRIRELERALEQRGGPK
jgi:sensor domain CHASE-containing protein